MCPACGNYLRVRGEYPPGRVTIVSNAELPPRARRILVRKTQKGHHHGTTSACAENTRILTLILRWGWNYLRVRGEYGCGRGWAPGGVELPPRARRIQELFVNPIIDYWNYLRVRGEYINNSPPNRIRSELPPRARRIPAQVPYGGHHGGTTSACAENTGTFGYLIDTRRNYLRVRGEYVGGF